MQQPLVEGYFRDDHDKPNKPTIFESNSMHMGCFKKFDYIVYCYMMNGYTCKWIKRLCSHLWELSMLNSWILFSACDANIS